MSAATTFTTALRSQLNPLAAPLTREERKANVAKYFAAMKEQDTFINVGPCRSTGKEVTICYNTHGDPKNPCLLLVQGLGTSLAGWPLDMIDYFVDQGFYVVRYDNRDVGRSSRFDEYGMVNILRFALPAWASLGEKLAYTLEDMAEDGIGLMRALHIDKFHVFGMSMGGMIVQLMAARHPDKVLSLNIFCSHMGGRDEVQPGLTTYVRFIVPPRSNTPQDRAAHMAWFINFLSQGQYRDASLSEELQDYVLAGFARDGTPNNFSNVRQIAAIMRAPSRRPALTRVSLPTVVMHGMLDPLIPVENGKRIAQAVPGAKLVLFPNLGHDLPEAIQLDIAVEVVLNMKRVTA